MNYYSAAMVFCAPRRLTGFGFTRNIIRVRTIALAARDVRSRRDTGLQAFTW
jgi:hypothetical protein